MAKRVAVAIDPMVRLTPKLVKQIDAHAKYLRDKTGMSVSRTSAARALLTEALEKKGQKA